MKNKYHHILMSRQCWFQPWNHANPGSASKHALGLHFPSASQTTARSHDQISIWSHLFYISSWLLSLFRLWPFYVSFLSFCYYCCSLYVPTIDSNYYLFNVFVVFRGHFEPRIVAERLFYFCSGYIQLINSYCFISKS